MKRSPDEMHTQTHGSLIESLRRSQMSFSSVNVCEHLVKMALHDRFRKVPRERVRDRKNTGDGGKIEWKSSEINNSSCWNVHILHNLPPDTNHIICHYLKLSF